MLQISQFVVFAYGVACTAFYFTERKNLLGLMQTYADVGDFETAVVFGLMAYMCLGYISGFKRLIAMVFMY